MRRFRRRTECNQGRTSHHNNNRAKDLEVLAIYVSVKSSLFRSVMKPPAYFDADLPGVAVMSPSKRVAVVHEVAPIARVQRR